jgi:hypothetical protein
MTHVRFAFFPDNGEVLAVNVNCRFGFFAVRQRFSSIPRES